MARFSRMSRGIRFALITLGLLVGALLVCEVAGWPFLRGPLESVANKQLKREVRIEAPFKLHLLGGIKLNVGRLWIASRPEFEAPHLVDASNVTLRLRYSDLIGWDPATEGFRIKSLQVDKLDAYLLRNDKTATWQFSEKKKSETPTPFPVIEAMVVREGAAVVRDTITDADLKTSFSTQEGSGTDNAVSTIEAKGKFRKHPIQTRITTQGFLPVATQDRDSPPVNTKGWLEYGGVRVDFNGSISDIFGEKDVRGNFVVKGPSLGIAGDLFNITLPTTTEFTIKGDIKREDEVLAVNIASARVGSTDLYGTFKYDTSDEKAYLEGDLKSTNFVLADLGPTFGTRGEDGNEVEKRPGYVIPDRPLNLPALNRFNASIKLDFERVELGKAFKRPIAPFRADLNLKSGSLSLAKVYARTADGTLGGTISVDARALGASGNPDKDDKSRPQPVWKAHLNWKDINLEKWLNAPQGRKQEARENPEIRESYVTGILNGEVRLTGRGNSTAELVSSLDGDASAYISKGTMSHLIIEVLGLDVAQGLGLVIKGDKDLPMQCALWDFKAVNGLVSPQVAVIDTPVTVILTDGNVNMGKEQLNLRFVAKPKNASPFTVRSPILITGTFADPKVRPKAEPIAARVLGSIALAFVNPLAALLPFIDPGSGEKSPCGEALREFNTGKANPVSSARVTGKANPDDNKPEGKATDTRPGNTQPSPIPGRD